MFTSTKKLRSLTVVGALFSGLLCMSAAQAARHVPGVTKTEVRVGTLGPQTGPAAAYDGVRKGIVAYFDYINSQGGVNGRKLTLFAYDDQYQPAKSVRLMHRLVDQDHIFATLGDVGSPTTAAIEKYVKKKEIPMIMLCSAASRFFDPPIPNFMGSCIASYAFEAKVMVHYAIKTLGDKRIAIAYDNDDYGAPINVAAAKAMKHYPNAQVVARVKLQPTASDFSAQAQEVHNAKPDAILIFGTPSPTAHLKKALYTIGVNSGNTDILTTQEGGSPASLFSMAGESAWQGTYAISEVPPIDTDTKPMKFFKQEFIKAFPTVKPSEQPEMGWASAQVFVEALRRTKSLTRKNFLHTFYTFHDWKGSLYSGISFSKDNHHGVTTLFITQAQDGKMVPVTGLISINPKTGKFTVEHATNLRVMNPLKREQ